MTETQTLLDALGWTREYAASRTPVSVSTMRYWARGANERGTPTPAPEWILVYLRRCLAALDEIDPEAVLRSPGKKPRDKTREQLRYLNDLLVSVKRRLEELEKSQGAGSATAPVQLSHVSGEG
jgi:hypothetical protein